METRNASRKFSTIRDFFKNCGGRFLELHGKQGAPLRLTVEELYHHFTLRAKLEARLEEIQLREKPIELSRERVVKQPGGKNV
jgi:hypothetical protein